MPEDAIEETGRAIGELLSPLLIAAAAGLAGYLLARLIGALTRRIWRRHPVTAAITTQCRRPLRAMMVVAGWFVGFYYATLPRGEEPPVWRGIILHALVILLIITLAWLASRIATVAEESISNRYHFDKADDRRARRVVTQAQMIRRIITAAVWLLALAAILMTFPAARTLGTSIFASAGIASVVAGLAAQTTLANTFAGMQLAFTDGIRVDDIVIVEGEYGRIEEITLTYVVVHIWDDRRLVMPATYFTTTPFENWTRRPAELLGTVSFDLDWSVPLTAMREELNRLLEASDLWDGRAGSLQLIDAVDGGVRARVTVSAADAGKLWDLRCYVREGLVEWLQVEAPEALPRTRFLEVGNNGRPTSPARRQSAEGATSTPSRDAEPAREGNQPAAADAKRGPKRTSVWQRRSASDIEHDASFYTATIAGRKIAEAFSGPGEDVIQEREERARQDDEPVGESDGAEESADGAEEPADGADIADTKTLPSDISAKGGR